MSSFVFIGFCVVVSFISIDALHRLYAKRIVVSCLLGMILLDDCSGVVLFMVVCYLWSLCVDELLFCLFFFISVFVVFGFDGCYSMFLFEFFSRFFHCFVSSFDNVTAAAEKLQVLDIVFSSSFLR